MPWASYTCLHMLTPLFADTSADTLTSSETHNWLTSSSLTDVKGQKLFTDLC